MNPRLTIITPNFNKGSAVSECVQSVINQEFSNFELLFIDDGSTDGSFKKAIDSAHGDERCVFLENNSGIKGANAARNMAIDLAKGEFIIFLDSDDLMSECCILNRINDLDSNSELDFIAYPMGIFDTKIGDSDYISNIPTNTTDLHRFLNRDIVWQISGPIWKKTALKKLGGFDLTLHSQQDVDLHIRALIAGLSYKYIHRKPDIYYRQEIESVPRQNSHSLEHFRQRFEMILRHEVMIREAGILNEEEKLLLAKYLLDLAQMMRWHIVELGKEALTEGLEIWKKAFDLKLVTKAKYDVGVTYIRFKHNMTFNKLRFLQRYMERSFRKNLGRLIFYPSTTYSQVTMEDYEE